MSSDGLNAALRALKGRKGEPTDADRPPLGVFKGAKHRLLPGQLDVFGREHQPPQRTEKEEEPAA